MIIRPSFFFAFWWILWFVIDQFISVTFNIFLPIHMEVYIYLTVVIIFVLIGGFVSRFLPIISARNLTLNRLSLFKFSGQKFWIISLSFILIMTILERQLTISSNIFTSESINLYRRLVTEEGVNRLFPFLSFLNFFIFLSGPYIIFHVEKISKLEKTIIVVTVACLVYLGASRSFAFVVLLMIFFAYTFKNGFSLGVFITVTLILFFLFTLIGSAFGKDNPFEIIAYYIAPLHAFSELYIDPSIFGENFDFMSFRFLQPFLYKMSLIDSPALLLPYVNTPLPVNVYSIFHTYWYDLGCYSLIFWFGFGLMVDWIYKLYYSRKTFSSLSLICLIYTCIVLSVFFDYFTSAGFLYFSVLFLFFFSDEHISKGN